MAYVIAPALAALIPPVVRARDAAAVAQPPERSRG
jgi:hypothetical protein